MKEGKFSFVIPYKLTAGGKIAPGTLYDKCWRASAKELGKVPSDFIGQYVTLEKQPRLLFSKPVIDPETKMAEIGADGKRVYEEILAVDQAGRPKCFCFVPDEAANTNTVRERVRTALIGKTPKAALRTLLLNFKQYPEYKDALNNGTLDSMLELVVVDGKFQKDEGGQSATGDS